MKTQKIRPQLAAPVKREMVATVSPDGNAIAPQTQCVCFRSPCPCAPFAENDAG